MRPLVIRKLKSFGSLEITGRRAVDGLDGLSTGSSISLFITFPTVPGNLLRITTHFRIAKASL